MMGKGPHLHPNLLTTKKRTKNINLGLRKVESNVGSKALGGGFKIGSARKSKDWAVGLKSLDPKNHSVVVMDENSNPNFSNLFAGKHVIDSTIPTFQQHVSTPSLSNALRKDKGKLGESIGGGLSAFARRDCTY